MALKAYDNAAAVAYARQWAMTRNPKYYDYDSLGGDCTNFASQCLYAGSGVMNYKPTFGWYYSGANNHSPSWTGVPYLYNFLTRQSGAGPVGKEVSMDEVQPGDISQFADTSARFTHTQVIVSIEKGLGLDGIFVATHTYDSLDRALSSYQFLKMRFVHILGVRE